MLKPKGHAQPIQLEHQNNQQTYPAGSVVRMLSLKHPKGRTTPTVLSHTQPRRAPRTTHRTHTTSTHPHSTNSRQTRLPLAVISRRARATVTAQAKTKQPQPQPRARGTSQGTHSAAPHRRHQRRPRPPRRSIGKCHPPPAQWPPRPHTAISRMNATVMWMVCTPCFGSQHADPLVALALATRGQLLLIQSARTATLHSGTVQVHTTGWVAIRVFLMTRSPRASALAGHPGSLRSH